MARSNKNVPSKITPTHEGGRGMVEKPLFQLRRTLSTCMLFEDTFYESGSDIANRLKSLAAQVTKQELIDETFKAKHDLHLRHAPLFMAREATRLHQGSEIGDLIYDVITRADELAEFVALYWRDGKEPLSAQAKKALARAFDKFDEYQFAKYDRDTIVKLRDVMFLVHPKPGKEREAMFQRIAERSLKTPDTWEVGLSAAKSADEKKAVWERLLSEKKLGVLALLRNLRNMGAVGVDRSLVVDALKNAKYFKILPFQFIAAWKYAPSFAREVEDAMALALKHCSRIPGKTAIVVDVSGSMGWGSSLPYGMLSSKSKMARTDAAGGLAIALNNLSDQARIWSFSNRAVEVPNARGFGLIDSLWRSQPNGGTNLGESLEQIKPVIQGYDRVVVITDEQAHDYIVDCGCDKQYILNVAPYKVGLETGGKWIRISGFSTSIIDWMLQEEEDNLW